MDKSFITKNKSKFKRNVHKLHQLQWPRLQNLTNQLQTDWLKMSVLSHRESKSWRHQSNFTSSIF